MNQPTNNVHVARQLTLGVMDSIQVMTFGAVPRRRSRWRAIAPLLCWVMLAAIVVANIAAAAAG